jgi:hypothetical protein
MGRWHYLTEALVIFSVQHYLTLARGQQGFSLDKVVQGKEYVRVCPCESVANFKNRFIQN